MAEHDLHALNNIREKIIIEKAYLIVEQEMPQCLLEFVTHVVGYKAVLAKWSGGDYSERRSLIDFPPELRRLRATILHALKAEQQRLMHSSLWNFYYRIVHRKRPNSANQARKIDLASASCSAHTWATAFVSRASRGRFVLPSGRVVDMFDVARSG